jgi:hypothetical protein
VRCLAHIVHNAFKYAVEQLEGKDPSKERSGMSSPTVFVLEQISSLSRRCREEMGIQHIPLCEEACQTRWGSHARVALWLANHFATVFAAVLKQVSSSFC